MVSAGSSAQYLRSMQRTTLASFPVDKRSNKYGKSDKPMMAADFRKYLVAEIVSEKRTISYRSLSRALKVHVNAAKCMLYEFYEQEQKKKAGSIYATYMVSGVKKVPSPEPLTNGRTNGVNGDEDPKLPSSPPPFTSSMLEPSQEDEVDQEDESLQVPVKTVTLVREETLEELKEQYETITSIHIYSLSLHHIPDLVELTDIGRAIWTDHLVKEDPLQHNETYGVILNPEVRRRTSRRPLVVEATPPKFKAAKKESKPAAKETAQAPTLKKEDSRPGSAGSTTSSSSTKQPTLKRDASDLFKSFAKTRPPKPKLGREDTGTSAEDTKMTDADEGESEDDALFLDTNTRTKKRGSDAKKERADKAAKLRKMMDSDDEAETALPDVEKASAAKAAPPTARNAGDDATNDKEDVAWSDSDTEKQRQRAPAKDNSTHQEQGQQITVEAEAGVAAEPKRRRGRRKVMKKRTMKDEDGYLVTKEEAAWESFSEEEQAPAKKPNSAFPARGSSSQARSSASSGKGAGVGAGAGPASASGPATGNKGGNNIMSFFGKK